MFMLTLLFLLFLPGLQCAPDCLEFTVGSCSPDPGQVIHDFPLPDTAEKWQICEDLCVQTDDCGTWSLHCYHSSCPCSLYKYSYLHSCHVVAGGVATDLEVQIIIKRQTHVSIVQICLDQSAGTCGDLVEEECQLHGRELWNDKVKV